MLGPPFTPPQVYIRDEVKGAWTPLVGADRQWRNPHALLMLSPHYGLV